MNSRVVKSNDNETNFKASKSIFDLNKNNHWNVKAYMCFTNFILDLFIEKCIFWQVTSKTIFKVVIENIISHWDEQHEQETDQVTAIRIMKISCLLNKKKKSNLMIMKVSRQRFQRQWILLGPWEDICWNREELHCASKPINAEDYANSWTRSGNSC